jgi:hypothetical protein
MARTRRSPRSPRAKRGKKVAYELIPPDSHHGQRMYPMLRQLVEAYHEELRDARIALAWCTSWKPDADGRMKLGMCKRASDLDRELTPYDFIILLNQPFWLSDQVTFLQRQALLDHELCHAAVKVDGTGEPVVDERDRVVYRTRKHDVEEFREIVDRWGVWKEDLESFAQALARHMPQRKDEAIQEARELMASCEKCDGTTWREIVAGGERATVRCDCFVQGQELIRAVEVSL